jgi:hypothetical protein
MLRSDPYHHSQEIQQLPNPAGLPLEASPQPKFYREVASIHQIPRVFLASAVYTDGQYRVELFRQSMLGVIYQQELREARK